MFISCGQDELYRSPKKAYFSCLIGLYFLSFFYEHPVCQFYVIRNIFINPICGCGVKIHPFINPLCGQMGRPCPDVSEKVLHL